MAHKQMLFQSAAREKVLRGATAMADAVRVTLGPKSKCVLVEKKWGAPLVCNDGVTIAKEVDLKDPEENLGAQVLREAAVRTGDVVGDGTTTATLLAHTIFAEGLRNVAAGASAVDLKRGLDRGLRVAVEALRKLSRPVQSRKEKAQVAAISAHNDASIGELVADAVEKVGAEGAITVEDVVNSRMVAYPLTLQQCCGIADGAAAVVVGSREMMKKLGIAKPVKVAGVVVESGPYHNRPRDITGDDITETTSEKLYEESGIGPKEVDILELHDAFTIAELLYYECMGLCRKGDGLKFLRDGQSTYGGQCVVSPRGGLLSYGHPIGASGAAQIAQNVKQLRGECGGHQVGPTPKVAMSHVTGGGLSGTEHAACTMHMLVKGW